MAEAAVFAFQSQEYAQASVVYSDLELAWQLQLNEALAESAAMSGVAKMETASAVEGDARREEQQAHATNAGGGGGGGGGGGDRAIAYSEMSGELWRRQQELLGQEKALKERQDAAVEIQRRLHDKEFARLISEMPEEQWEHDGDKFEKPFVDRNGKVAGGDGGRAGEANDVCNLFFAKTREDPGYVGMAWALTEPSGHVLFQQSKMLGLRVSAYAADYTALINGLAYARSVGVRTIVARGDSALVPNQISGQWRARSPSQVKFLDQVREHEKELDGLTVTQVARNKNSYVINLARQAIQAHVANLRKDGQRIPARPNEEEMTEDCPICFEQTRALEMFTVKSCHHRFCLDCLSHHVEVRVKENLVPVRCPLECSNHLEFEQCKPYLPPTIADAFARAFARRLSEASVPEADRVYCPFPNCSALMSKGGLNLSIMGSSSSHPHASSIGRCKCTTCQRLFCVQCQVPWHADLSCAEYQRLPPDERDAEDVKVFQLAKNQKWQRCKKCKHVIELDTGCFHMTCKCGHEFCYTCGAEWKNKQATCKCKLWDEDNIIEGDDVGTDDEETESDYDYDSDPGDEPLNVFYKTRICRHWANGFCWAGARCQFAHGQDEIRYPRTGMGFLF